MPEAISEGVLPDPSAGLLLQFLAWVASRPRTYRETMDAWRTSCPRLSVWEDACEDGLVQIEGAITGVQGQAKVTLTATGAERLQTSAASQRP
jgi:hypothetical protein